MQEDSQNYADIRPGDIGKRTSCTLTEMFGNTAMAATDAMWQSAAGGLESDADFLESIQRFINDEIINID